jgi:predicted short-subunit dehydrogenase-like oxidoreductase (DUF2520 family)
MLKVIILGGGNVAFHLINELLQKKNIHLIQVYNRTLDSINCFASKTKITNKLNNLLEADIYMISVSDDYISMVSESIPFKNKLVVHTSGSVAMSQLSNNHRKGVFYPLQTFSKERKVDFSIIPLCIEAEYSEDLNILQKVAAAINNNCYEINSVQRKNLHIAAVFVSNFVNHLYQIGHSLCKKNHVSFEILKPLIIETASKIRTLSPEEAQTGPAIRNDKKTIEKHITMLPENMQEIYTLLTKSIQNTNGKKL